MAQIDFEFGETGIFSSQFLDLAIGLAESKYCSFFSLKSLYLNYLNTYS